MILVYSLARCGSNVLTDVLNAASAFPIAYEPFNRDMYEGVYAALAESSLAGALDRLSRDFYGIKHVWNCSGWPFSVPALNAELLRSEKFDRVVVLYRRNRLSRFVSEEIARQTGVWRTTGNAAIERRKQMLLQKLDVSEMARLLDEETRSIEKLLAFTKPDRRYFVISYEELYEEGDVPDRLRRLAQLVQFLGLPFKPDNPKLQKFSTPKAESFSKSLYPAVPNIEEVKRLGAGVYGNL